MYPVQLLVLFSLATAAFAGTVPKKGLPNCDPNTGIGCMPSPHDCPQGCADAKCNKTEVETVVYEEVEDKEIVVDDEIVEEKSPGKKVEYKFVRTVTNYGSAGISAILHEKVERVFKGIMMSAALFIICAVLCVLSVCLYCCHIRKTDHKLKLEVDGLAKKLKVNVKKPGPSKPTTDHIGDSCNVVVQDANVMCV